MKGFTIYSNCPICGQEREGFIEIEVPITMTSLFAKTAKKRM